MKINNIYTSIATNRTPAAVDWSRENLILFGASNGIALFDPNHNSSSKIVQLFVEHSGRVNTVKWIETSNSAKITKFISGSNDRNCLIWDIADRSNPVVCKLNGHDGGVTVVETIDVNNEILVATAATDSTIKLWSNGEENVYKCFQTIPLGNGLCFALRMARLPGTDTIILAVATDDDRIHLYSEQIQGSYKFEKIETLVGHEDWVRGLDFILNDKNELLLASSSQDGFVRLWKISPRTSSQDKYKQVADLLPGEQIKIEEKIFSVKSKNSETHSFATSLESVLHGHDGWVYGVHWNKLNNGSLQLLSSSIDKTLILWMAQEDSGVWLEKVRVGDVGGNSLGFFGGKISATGKSILGHGYQGSLHMWHQDEANPGLWAPGVVVGGHFDEVRDLAWEPNGQYLMSLSADQTTRIHVPWNRPNVETTTWHELARPQVHGYDMQTLAILTRYRFASGAEEKIVRTFQAPGNFIENFRRIVGISDEDDVEGTAIIRSNPRGASVPSLGLSNKAVYETDEPAAPKHVKDEYPENYFVPITLTAPPPEDTLMQNTLWPEVQKLYGHGYEVFALCATSDGQLLASSCKATSAEHAKIILWNTTTWKQQQKLAGHQLTITQMSFSPCNQYLLSVSRDRRWCLFKNANQQSSNETANFELIATIDKKNGYHGRIVWCCAWAHDSQYFATGSRDGKLVVWHQSAEKAENSLGSYAAVKTIELKGQSLQAVAFSQKYWGDESKNQHLIAIGLETGFIHIFSFCPEAVTELLILDKSMAHHLTVKRLAFRPYSKRFQLASCGEDHLVRVYEIEDE